MDEVTVRIDGQEFQLDANGLEFLAHCMRMSSDQRQAMLRFAQNVVDNERRKKLLQVIEGGKQD
jgi:hypothetical protein